MDLDTLFPGCYKFGGSCFLADGMFAIQVAIQGDDGEWSMTDEGEARSGAPKGANTTAQRAPRAGKSKPAAEQKAVAEPEPAPEPAAPVDLPTADDELEFND